MDDGDAELTSKWEGEKIRGVDEHRFPVLIGVAIEPTPAELELGLWGPERTSLRLGPGEGLGVAGAGGEDDQDREQTSIAGLQFLVEVRTPFGIRSGQKKEVPAIRIRRENAQQGVKRRNGEIETALPRLYERPREVHLQFVELLIGRTAEARPLGEARLRLFGSSAGPSRNAPIAGC